MFKIISAHQLIAVAVPVNKQTLKISAEQVDLAVTPNTRAILITHLFGGIMETSGILTVAGKNNLIVIEDCAQAFVGAKYTGNSLSDVVMYSFGLIKTNTTINGALLQINHPPLFEKVIELNDQLPVQAKRVFFKKLLKTLFIKLLTTTVVYSLFYKYCTMKKKDFDDVLSGFTKGFPGTDILLKIRHRPSTPNINLLKRRLKTFRTESINKRKEYADNILKSLPESIKIGHLNKDHSYWVLPIEVKNSQELVNYLRSKGFDATQKASSLVKMESATAAGPNDLQMENLIYLPAFITMSKKDQSKLTGLLSHFAVSLS